MANRNNTERGGGLRRPPRNGRPSAGRMPVASRRAPLAVNVRPSQHSITKSSHKMRSLPWQHDLFEDSLRAAGISGVEVGTKLYVSNLDQGVTNDDIKELFSEIGELKRFSIHYDKNGQSSGSAEVVYLRRSDAFAALKRYSNVLLDGKPMIIEIVGANAGVPISARVNVKTNGRKKRTVVLAHGVGQSRNSAGTSRGPNRRGSMTMRNGRGGGVGGGRSRGRGRGVGKKKAVEKSADDLDKELENYHASAMNVS